MVDGPQNEIADNLAKNNVVVSPPWGSVENITHFYNNLEDIDRLVEALA